MLLKSRAGAVHEGSGAARERRRAWDTTGSACRLLQQMIGGRMVLSIDEFRVVCAARRQPAWEPGRR